MKLKQLAKTLTSRLAPDLSLKILSRRSRRAIEAQTHALGLDSLARSISTQTGGCVASGPFRGMLLDYEALRVHGAPKLLGTYEKELAPHLEIAISRVPQSVLNVGCSEGYYAVGLALRLPQAQVFAADADPKSIKALMRNAKLNGVDGRINRRHPGSIGDVVAV